MNRYTQISYLTQDTIWENHKTQENITYKRIERSALTQQGCKEQTRHHDRHETQITIKFYNRRTAFERSVKIMEGYNIVPISHYF